ncbi:hypothetical protein D3C87_1121680 [compost metagenome]
MSQAATELRRIAEQGLSKSTDKLAMLCIATDTISRNSPELLERIKTFSLEWNTTGKDILPVIKIEFHCTT